MSITSTIKNFKEDLQLIQQTTQQLMPQIPDNPLKTELQDVLKKIEDESGPLMEELKNLSLLTNVVQSLRRENEKLQGQTEMTEHVGLLQQENQRLQQQIEMLMAENESSSPQQTQMLPIQKKIMMAKSESQIAGTTVLPMEAPSEVQAHIPAANLESASVDSSEELYSEEDTLKDLQIEEEELDELVQRRRLSVVEKDEQRFFVKREVDMLRKISMESATMIVPKKQSKIKTLFGGMKKKQN